MLIPPIFQIYYSHRYFGGIPLFSLLFQMLKLGVILPCKEARCHTKYTCLRAAYQNGHFFIRVKIIRQVTLMKILGTVTKEVRQHLEVTQAGTSLIHRSVQIGRMYNPDFQGSVIIANFSKSSFSLPVELISHSCLT